MALAAHPTWGDIMIDPRELKVRATVRDHMDVTHAARGPRRGYLGGQVKANISDAYLGRLDCICAAWDVSRSDFLRAALARMLYADELGDV